MSRVSLLCSGRPINTPGLPARVILITQWLTEGITEGLTAEGPCAVTPLEGGLTVAGRSVDL